MLQLYTQIGKYSSSALATRCTDHLLKKIDCIDVCAQLSPYHGLDTLTLKIVYLLLYIPISKVTVRHYKANFRQQENLESGGQLDKLGFRGNNLNSEMNDPKNADNFLQHPCLPSPTFFFNQVKPLASGTKVGEGWTASQERDRKQNIWM